LIEQALRGTSLEHFAVRLLPAQLAVAFLSGEPLLAYSCALAAGRFTNWPQVKRPAQIASPRRNKGVDLLKRPLRHCRRQFRERGVGRREFFANYCLADRKTL
jgi:hypothetical protein